jgi:hypothetical protein
MLVFVFRDCLIALALKGLVAANNISITVRRCAVLDIPALRKASTASVFLIFVTMSEALSKMQPSCNKYHVK